MKREILRTHQKAFQINLDNRKYGTIAEIGAGQEVARWFFRVGGASGTIAKAMSAYDMKFSDAIYGACDRYVSRQRLETMLDHEYGLLVERLNAARGQESTFFAYADTVATYSYSRKANGHGWLGVCFQTNPMEEPSRIVLHCTLWGKESLQDQETLGIIGVNLIYGAMFNYDDPDELIQSLADNLPTNRVEIDLVEFSGPAFKTVDNRLISLSLVEHGLADATMFTSDGSVVHPADHLYKKPILVERGSFRPVTKVTMDMLRCGKAQFVQEPSVAGEDIIVLMEMTLKNLSDGNRIDHQDFLDRVDILCSLGKTVLISNYGEFHRLAAYLFRHTKKMIGIVMGIPTLGEIFEEKYYTDLGGGILESFGRMFKNDLKLYIYPLLDNQTSSVITASNLRVAPHLRHLYQYLLENQFIHSLRDIDESCLPIFSRDVLAKIRTNDTSWEEMVPVEVAAIIKLRQLFHYGEDQ